MGKAETDFNLKLDNHCKDVYKADAIPTTRNFAMKDHIFNRDASFVKMEQIRNSTLSRETKKMLKGELFDQSIHRCVTNT